MAELWEIIASAPSSIEPITTGIPTGVYLVSDYAGKPTGSGMTSSNKTGFTDAELMAAYLWMLSQSGGVADASWLAGMGFVSPTRYYNPFVFRPGQPGVKVLIHFNELSNYEEPPT